MHYIIIQIIKFLIPFLKTLEKGEGKKLRRNEVIEVS
jgi:hypothetical protein